MISDGQITIDEYLQSIRMNHPGIAMLDDMCTPEGRYLTHIDTSSTYAVRYIRKYGTAAFDITFRHTYGNPKPTRWFHDLITPEFKIGQAVGKLVYGEIVTGIIREIIRDKVNDRIYYMTDNGSFDDDCTADIEDLEKVAAEAIEKYYKYPRSIVIDKNRLTNLICEKNEDGEYRLQGIYHDDNLWEKSKYLYMDAMTYCFLTVKQMKLNHLNDSIYTWSKADIGDIELPRLYFFNKLHGYTEADYCKWNGAITGYPEEEYTT